MPFQMQFIAFVAILCTVRMLSIIIIIFFYYVNGIQNASPEKPHFCLSFVLFERRRKIIIFYFPFSWR